MGARAEREHYHHHLAESVGQEEISTGFYLPGRPEADEGNAQ